MLNAHGGWLLSSTEHAARAWRPVHVPSHRHEPPGREAGRLHLLDLLGRCVEASRCGITMAHSLVGVCVCVCVCVCGCVCGCVCECLLLWALWRPSPWRPFFGDSSEAVEKLTSVSWPDDGALAAARPLRGGDGRHHDVASRCGITMRHHDAHVVQLDGFFSRRAVKELTVSDGATALPTPRTCAGRLYYFII